MLPNTKYLRTALQTPTNAEQQKTKEKVPQAHRKVDFAKLLKQQNKLQTYIVLKHQTAENKMVPFFYTYRPLTPDAEQNDNVMLQQFFGWSDDVVNHDNSDIEIIVGKKFIKNNDKPQNKFVTGNQPIISERNFNPYVQNKDSYHTAESQPSSAKNPLNTYINTSQSQSSVNLDGLEKYLKENYEAYRLKFSQNQPERPVEKFSADDMVELQRSIKSEKSQRQSRQNSLPSKRLSRAAEEPNEELFEDICYNSTRPFGSNAKTLFGLHKIASTISKENKLTATTTATVSGFCNTNSEKKANCQRESEESKYAVSYN